MNDSLYCLEIRNQALARKFSRHVVTQQSATLYQCRGITLVELMVVLAIAITLGFVAVPVYSGYIDQAKLSTAIGDFALIDAKIQRFRSDNSGFLPDDLSDLGNGVPDDPWGNPYQFFNIEDTGPGKGKLRKDKNLNPLNSDYDLYSMGKDGESKLPLTPKVSHDDIIRANNGVFVGYARDY